MLSTKTYTVGVSRPYVNVSGVDSDKVIVVDRNGIGVKHITYFPGSEVVDLITYQYYGVKTETPTLTNDLKVLSNFVSGTDRQIILRVGDTPIAGYVFSVFYDSIIASYLVQSGDTAEDVRDAIIAAIDNESWGTTVVCTPIGTNRIQIDITGTTVNLQTKIGSQIYKKGYYVKINGISYIIEEKTDPNGYPTLSIAPTSLAFSLLIPIATSVEVHVTDALSAYTYSESSSSTVEITAIPSKTNVPFNQCVIDEALQQVWFPDDLSYGETIKIFEK